MEWWSSVHSIRVCMFNVFPEFATLIIHGYKTAEARNTLNVHNLAVHPWVGLWANPNRMDKHDTKILQEILRARHFLTDKDIEIYTANPHAGKGKGALVALLQLGLTGPADKVQRRRLQMLTRTDLHAEYKTLQGFEIDCTKSQKFIVEDIMRILKTRGSLAKMDAAWERESQATTKNESTRHACKITIACSKRGVTNRYLTNIICVKMLRENGVLQLDLNRQAGQGTWKADLRASDIEIENMTTSQLLSLSTMPYTDVNGFYHLGSK